MLSGFLLGLCPSPTSSRTCVGIFQLFLSLNYYGLIASSSPMIDTIKLLIPLTRIQYECIHQIAASTDKDQFAKVNLLSGELKLLRVAGLVETDQHSFHREIRWDVPPLYIPGCSLVVELSLPKFWYGDNVRLLYEPRKALELLRNYLNKVFGLKTRRKFCSVESWKVNRLDVCYTWRFPNQQLAQHFLDALKLQRFPYKEPTTRETSLTFTGGDYSTYSAKFYLKLPEFLKHDAKAMRKARAAESEIKFRQQYAEGLLRFEVTLREKWLRRNEIETVADVISPFIQLKFDEDMIEKLKPFWNPKLTFSAVLFYWADKNKSQEMRVSEVLKHGTYISAPPRSFEMGNFVYEHPGGGFEVVVTENRPEQILREMLEKMVGKNAGLRRVDKVRERLLETYKPTTAANLTAFWLYVQEFGSESAKEVYGKDAYYYKKRQLKKAKVSLLEMKNNTIIVGKDFFNVFTMSIPSEYAGNKYDDERDSINVLNIIPKLNTDVS